MELFSQKRQELLVRHRPLSDTHRMLAFFSAFQCRHSTTWEEKMDRWNEEQGAATGVVYQRVSQFRRDCETAQKRILSPNLVREAA